MVPSATTKSFTGGSYSSRMRPGRDSEKVPLCCRPSGPTWMNFDCSVRMPFRYCSASDTAARCSGVMAWPLGAAAAGAASAASATIRSRGARIRRSTGVMSP